MSTENNEGASALSSNSREASPPTAVFAKYIVILIVVASAALLFGVKPSLEGFFGNNAKISQQLETNKSNQATFNDLKDKQKNKLAGTEAEVQEFKKSFPAKADQKTMIDELNKIASTHGVSITSIAPTVDKAAKGKGKSEAASTDLVAPIKIEMSLSGGDPNGFLADLEKANRVFIIDSLSYNAADKGAATMSLKATTYVIQELVDPKSAPDANTIDTGAVTAP